MTVDLYRKLSIASLPCHVRPPLEVKVPKPDFADHRALGLYTFQEPRKKSHFRDHHFGGTTDSDTRTQEKCAVSLTWLSTKKKRFLGFAIMRTTHRHDNTFRSDVTQNFRGTSILDSACVSLARVSVINDTR